MVILGPTEAIPTLAAARLQRWAVFLLLTHIVIFVTHPQTNMLMVTCYQRLPLPEVTPVAQSPEASIWNIARIERFPVPANEIGHATEKGPQLKDVLPYTSKNGRHHTFQISCYHTVET